MKVSSELFDEIMGADKETLNGIIELIKIRQTRLSQDEANQYMKGDKVKFTSKDGVKIAGTVISVNQKSVSVDDDCGVGRWRVAPCFLSFA